MITDAGTIRGHSTADRKICDFVYELTRKGGVKLMAERQTNNNRHEQLRTKKKKKNKGLIALLVILVILAVGVAAFAVIFSRYYSLMQYVSDSQVAKEIAALGEVSVDDTGLSDEELEALRSSQGDSGVTLPENKDMYNLLLIGVDRREKSWAGNSDAMILLSINKKDKKIHMISFMRDLYADIPGHGVHKLNASCAYGGCPLVVTTIEQNYGVNIDNYVSVDFDGLINIVDAIGGVQLEVSDAEAEWANGYILDMANTKGEDPSPHYFSGGGTYLCDGYQATAYSRIRHIGNSDYERTERQRVVISAIADKVKGMGISELNDFAMKILPEVSHNIDTGTMLSLLSQVPTIARYEVDQDRVPYDGLYSTQGEILVPDMEATREKLYQTVYGG